MLSHSLEEAICLWASTKEEEIYMEVAESFTDQKTRYLVRESPYIDELSLFMGVSTDRILWAAWSGEWAGLIEESFSA